jgi:2-oxoglutarate dehydrogenase E2 component (dihydrolipoamide succinyltransferase)
MILEISTDKVDTEVPAPVGGVLAEVVVPEGTTVEVGTVIARIETEGSAIPEQVSEAKPVAETPAPASPAPAPAPASGQTASGNLVDVVMPKMGESLQEGTIIRWFKKVGDAIERDEMILEISTDKVDTEVPAPVGGVLAEVVVPEGTTVEVGTVIARIATSGTVVPSATVAKAPEPKQEQTPVVQQTVSQPTTSVPSVEAKTFEIPARYGEKFFSPLVREIAKQNKVSLEELLTIKGTGSEGRITKDDLLKYIENRGKAPAAPQAAPSVAVQPKAPATPSCS